MTCITRSSQITKSQVHRRLVTGSESADFPRLRDEDSSASFWIWPSSAILFALPAISKFSFCRCGDACCSREKCVCRFRSPDLNARSCALPVGCWYQKKPIVKNCVHGSRRLVLWSSGATSGLHCDSNCATESICWSVSSWTRCCVRCSTPFAISKSLAYGALCRDEQSAPAWLSRGLPAC